MVYVLDKQIKNNSEILANLNWIDKCLRELFMNKILKWNFTFVIVPLWC